MGPARMPASPASALPMPKTSCQIRPRSMPRARTMRASREPARMISPTLVRSRKSQSPMSTTIVAPSTKRRYVGKTMKPRFTALDRRGGGDRVRPILPQTRRTVSIRMSESPKVRRSGSSGEPPDEEALDEEPEAADHEGSEEQRGPEALGEAEEEEAEVRPQHVEGAVGEIHHRHQPEDQGQTDGEQHEDHPQHEAREHLGRENRQRDVEHLR